MIQTYCFSTWSDFKSLIGERLSREGVFKCGKFLFRGQENAEWKLVSSFDREFKCIKYETLIENFEKEYQHIPAVVQSKPEYFPALGQHYGLPTRLLDWSESYYIAAFFAYQKALHKLEGKSLSRIKAENNSIAIWALDRTKEFWAPYIVRPPTGENKRLYEQMGYFIKIPHKNDYISLDDLVEKTPTSEVLLWKLIIPLREVVEVMADLSFMGLNANILMGGDEGRAQATLNKTILDSIKL